MSAGDFEPDIRDHSAEFDAAEQTLMATVAAFAAGEITQGQAEQQIERLLRVMRVASERWVRETLPNLYRDALNSAERDVLGAQTAQDTLKRSPHRSMMNIASAAVLDDLLVATDNMGRDAKNSIREIASRNLASAMISGPRLAAGNVAADMERRGVRVTDSGGRRWRARGYSEMVMRTKTIETYNRAHVGRAAELGSPGVMVVDGGPGDVDQPCLDANGQYWGNDYAATHLSEHPNCRRSFTPLPRSWRGRLDRE